MHLKIYQRKRGKNQTILDYKSDMCQGICLFCFVLFY